MKKNKKINQKADSNIEQLLRKKTKTIQMDIPYIRLGILLSLIICWICIPIMWSFWLVLVIIWLLVLSAHVKKRRINAERKERIKHLFFEEDLRVAIKKRYPTLLCEHIALLILGYKDFLHVSLMSPIFTKMPSKALDDIWTTMNESSNGVFQQTKYLLGFVLTRRGTEVIKFEHEGYKLLDDKRKFMERNITWKFACQLNGLNPSTTKQFPRLYLIDQALNWDSAYEYDIDLLTEEYRLYKKHYNKYEELSYFIEHEIPHLGIHANIPSDDST